MSDRRRFDTELIHGGETRPRVGGAAVLPIFQCAVYEYDDADGGDYHDVRYPRLNNLPNHVALTAKLARLESGEAALVTASGMAAISTALLSVLRGGGHLLSQRCVYGGTLNLMTEDLPGLGFAVDFIDARKPDTWATLRRPQTRAIYVEAMTNPLLEVADHRAVVAFAREHGLVSIIDNTFATPLYFRPLELGYDLVVHSATKYLNGHSDLVAGAVIGSADHIQPILHLLNHLGGSLDPHACYLLHRGLKTLAVRVARQNQTAQAVAEFLASRPEVARVHYPGLADHPEHARARELFSGFGGMLSLELRGGMDATRRLIDRLEIPIYAPSLGGPETLVTRPATTSHKGMDPGERVRLGITDSLLRISIGLEDPRDLIDDFDRALRAAGQEPSS